MHSYIRIAALTMALTTPAWGASNGASLSTGDGVNPEPVSHVAALSMSKEFVVGQLLENSDGSISILDIYTDEEYLLEPSSLEPLFQTGLDYNLWFPRFVRNHLVGHNVRLDGVKYRNGSTLIFRALRARYSDDSGSGEAQACRSAYTFTFSYQGQICTKDLGWTLSMSDDCSCERLLVE